LIDDLQQAVDDADNAFTKRELVQGKKNQERLFAAANKKL